MELLHARLRGHGRVEPGHDKLIRCSPSPISPIRISRRCRQPRWSELIGKRVTGYINWQRKRRFIHDRRRARGRRRRPEAQAPDHIAVTGDIANIALPEEFPRGRDWLESLGHARRTSRFVPGNHDVYVREAARYAAAPMGRVHARRRRRERLPFVRRRGPLALIGAVERRADARRSSRPAGSAPTQLAAPGGAAASTCAGEALFRVVLIHHPPVSEARRHKRLLDAPCAQARHRRARRRAAAARPRPSATCSIGCPGQTAAACRLSACRRPRLRREERERRPRYHLYRIEGSPGAWRCEMIARGLGADGAVSEQKRIMLAGNVYYLCSKFAFSR